MAEQRNILAACPSNLDQLTLGAWSRFYVQYGKKLDEQQAALLEQKDDMFRSLDESSLQVERMYCFAAFFTNTTLKYAKRTFRLGEVATAYNSCFAKMFNGADTVVVQREFTWNEEQWVLPAVELMPNSKMTFGEFIDSKVVVQDAHQQKQTRWELLHQVAAIFLRKPGETYTDEFIMPDSERLELLNHLPMRIALAVGEWFDQFNTFLDKSFPVFHKSDIKGGRNMKMHFAEWGWINFLKSIAQTKVFDVPAWGVDSIECARRAKCFDVLIYASEDKSYNEAQYYDMEDAKRESKRTR